MPTLEIRRFRIICDMCRETSVEVERVGPGTPPTPNGWYHRHGNSIYTDTLCPKCGEWSIENDHYFAGRIKRVDNT